MSTDERGERRPERSDADAADARGAARRGTASRGPCARRRPARLLDPPALPGELRAAARRGGGAGLGEGMAARHAQAPDAAGLAHRDIVPGHRRPDPRALHREPALRGAHLHLRLHDRHAADDTKAGADWRPPPDADRLLHVAEPGIQSQRHPAPGMVRRHPAFHDGAAAAAGGAGLAPARRRRRDRHLRQAQRRHPLRAVRDLGPGRQGDAPGAGAPLAVACDRPRPSSSRRRSSSGSSAIIFRR